MMEWLISPLAPNSAVPFVWPRHVGSYLVSFALYLTLSLGINTSIKCEFVLEVDVVDQCSEVGPVTMASNGLYVLERLSQ